MTSQEWEGSGWRIAICDGVVSIAGSVQVSPIDPSRLDVDRSWFRWHLLIDGRAAVRLRGISGDDALAIRGVLRRLALAAALDTAIEWQARVRNALTDARSAQRWLPSETVEDLERSRPAASLGEELDSAGSGSAFTDAEAEAVRFSTADLRSLAAATNEEVVVEELKTRRRFFDTIEKSPLTEEQARAVLCFDNRVQVLASAGSGKTSVMVARAAYAVERGFVAPERILLLAFNKAAASELEERIAERFRAAGIDSTGLRAATFHSFGLDVIGRATGEKPRLAPWLGKGDDQRLIARIADELRDSSPEFRFRWDLYRTLFASTSLELDGGTADGYDRETSTTGYRTFAGELVKSHGERLIANFLFLNGVNYRYEHPYVHDVADAAHSQYRPDFYYPDIDVWHEHWAIGRDGRPPQDFVGYEASMTWKRDLHSQHGTTLVESTWADVVFGSGLEDLQARLSDLGVRFDWDPDRPRPDRWAKPLEHEDLARLVRTFLVHIKSNSWTKDDVEARLRDFLPGHSGYRTELFLGLFWPVYEEWERRLAEDRSVDFEDMLVRAAAHLEAGDVTGDYDLVMVDEFQDASRARARLVQRLVAQPGRYLLAVGDDWQAINRFAGADLSVMTDFASWFGRSEQLALTTTFRCPQLICDAASSFVTKNPNQFAKPMRSAHSEPGLPISAIETEDPARAVAGVLERLSRQVAAGEVPAGPGGRVSVDVLGRYGFDRNLVPRRPPPNLDVTFRSVHGSKGLEADYVIVPNLVSGTYGFPSSISDDPILDLAMPAPEQFADAEERRLFYVALTRARRHVTLITHPSRPSPFVAELLADGHLALAALDGTKVVSCSVCRKGTMVLRTGPYGPFLGCSTFPACKATRKV